MEDLKNLNCLLPKTKSLLLEIIDNCEFLNKYVLVGGSALTLHLCHRKSEDLDFFTYSDSFDKKEILNFIKQFKTKTIINQTNEQIDLLINEVKVTFFNAKWEFLTPKIRHNKKQKVNLARIEELSAMKVHVLFLRAKYRDYYDLYFILKTLSLQEIFENSTNIVEGITYKLFVTSLLYIDDIEDDNIEYLEPMEILSKEDIRDFFQNKMLD